MRNSPSPPAGRARSVFRHPRFLQTPVTGFDGVAFAPPPRDVFGGAARSAGGVPSGADGDPSSAADWEIVVVADGASPVDTLVGVLSRHHRVGVVGLADLRPRDFPGCLLYVIDVDLRDRATVRALRGAFGGDDDDAVPRLFIVGAMARREIVQATALGAADFLARPVDAALLAAVMKKLVSGAVERQWTRLNPTQKAALTVSLGVFEDCFARARQGEPLPADDVRESCRLVLEATSMVGIDRWMSAVRNHHHHTYRHSMIVCGLLSYFAYMIGIRGEELERLTVGGMLHDIGKVFTPLELLDKDGPLTDEEWVIMRQHPGHAWTVFGADHPWHPDVVDIAAHHHERLDGSGYPDGLAGARIGDAVRMASIADVFAGMTEKRVYKPARTYAEAFAVMDGMGDQLDMPLVRSFRDVILGS